VADQANKQAGHRRSVSIKEALILIKENSKRDNEPMEAALVLSSDLLAPAMDEKVSLCIVLAWCSGLLILILVRIPGVVDLAIIRNI